MRGLLASIVLLVVAPAATLSAEQKRLRVVPLLTISYPPPNFAVANHGGIVFSDQFVFFGTDGGLFRAPLPIVSTTQPERVAFEWTPVTGLAYRSGVLYAILDQKNPTGPGATTHSLLKSIDQGASWTPIDSELEECFGGTCEFLSASQIEVIGDRIFVNAGGNVLVSASEGSSWTILQGVTSTGRPQAQACYDPSFAIVERRLLIGGECPLDFAYLRTGTLRPDLLGWEQEPGPAATPLLENRNVQFIRQRGDSSVVYAGIEGALLRSDDAGANYAFLLYYPGDAVKYPYITHILFPSKDPSVIIVGGFDKARGGPFLAVSSDNGATWIDESHLLPGVGIDHWSVSALEETPDGQILIAVDDDAVGSFHVSELLLTRSERRRSVRRNE
jgi:hypothetical protein